MKVYELMNELKDLPSGLDLKVNICITTEELKDGKEIETGLYCKEFDISGVDELGTISTEN